MEFWNYNSKSHSLPLCWRCDVVEVESSSHPAAQAAPLSRHCQQHRARPSPGPAQLRAKQTLLLLRGQDEAGPLLSAGGGGGQAVRRDVTTGQVSASYNSVSEERDGEDLPPE